MPDAPPSASPSPGAARYGVGYKLLRIFADVRKTRDDREKGLAGAEEEAKVQEQPLRTGGGFRLIFRSRYLLLIAVMIGLYNFVNATGEFIMTEVTVKRSIAAAAPGRPPTSTRTPSISIRRPQVAPSG